MSDVEAWMIIKNPGDEDAYIRELDYAAARGSMEQFIALGHGWRPIAHGVRVVLQQDDNLGEVQYVDFVDAVAFAADVRRGRSEGKYRD